MSDQQGTDYMSQLGGYVDLSKINTDIAQQQAAATTPSQQYLQDVGYVDLFAINDPILSQIQDPALRGELSAMAKDAIVAGSKVEEAARDVITSIASTLNKMYLSQPETRLEKKYDMPVVQAWDKVPPLVKNGLTRLGRTLFNSLPFSNQILSTVKARTGDPQPLSAYLKGAPYEWLPIAKIYPTALKAIESKVPGAKELSKDAGDIMAALTTYGAIVYAGTGLAALAAHNPALIGGIMSAIAVASQRKDIDAINDNLNKLLKAINQTKPASNTSSAAPLTTTTTGGGGAGGGDADTKEAGTPVIPEKPTVPDPRIAELSDKLNDLQAKLQATTLSEAELRAANVTLQDIVNSMIKGGAAAAGGYIVRDIIEKEKPIPVQVRSGGGGGSSGRPKMIREQKLLKKRKKNMRALTSSLGVESDYPSLI